MFRNDELVYTVFYVLLFLVLVFIAIAIFVYKSRKKIFAKELEKKDLEIKFQKEILLHTIITQEQERERIAQDLHDEISSRLNVMSLNLYSLLSTSKNERQKQEVVNSMIDINNVTIENSRRIAHNLLPPVLEKFGLHRALEELVLDFEHIQSVLVWYTNNADFSGYDNKAQLHIFRIIQELLNNSLRHGKATKIDIVFKKNKEKVQCTYSDNGLGFDTTNLANNKGLGIRNIESRISFLNGQYTIQSHRNEGVLFNFVF